MSAGAAVAAATQSAQAPVHARLRGVTRVFEGKLSVHALGPLDLDLARGEFFSVVGPSGCGKTTLMDLIAGLSAPTEGTITFEDKPVAGEVPDGIGAVFQEDASFPVAHRARQYRVRAAPRRHRCGRDRSAASTTPSASWG